MSEDIQKSLLEQTLSENNGILPDDVVVLERILQQEGIDITAAGFDTKISERYNRIDKEFDEKSKQERVRPEWVYKVRAFMLGVLDTFSIITAFIMQVLFPFVSLLLFYIVEIETAQLGIKTFFTDESKSNMLAMVIITGYFVIVWLTARESYKTETKPRLRFTLANIVSRFLYITGFTAFRFDIGIKPFKFNVHRKALMTSPLTNHESVLFIEFVSAVLIALMGTLGRLGDELLALADATKDVVNDGPKIASDLSSLYNDSSLLQWLEYATSFLIVVVLLVFTHFMIKHIYGIYIKVVGQDELDFFDYASHEEARQLEKQKAKIQFYQFNIQKIIEKQKSQAVSKVPIGLLDTQQKPLVPQDLNLNPIDAP